MIFLSFWNQSWYQFHEVDNFLRIMRNEWPGPQTGPSRSREVERMVACVRSASKTRVCKALESARSQRDSEDSPQGPPASETSFSLASSQTLGQSSCFFHRWQSWQESSRETSDPSWRRTVPTDRVCKLPLRLWWRRLFRIGSDWTWSLGCIGRQWRCGGNAIWCNLARSECCRLQGKPHKRYRFQRVASAATSEGRSSRRAARWKHGTWPRCCASGCRLSRVRWGRGRCQVLLCICQSLSVAPCLQVLSGTHRRLRWRKHL